MASENDCGSSLTVDAYPSPPRVENDDSKEANSEFVQEDDTKSKPRSHKTKKRKFPPNACSISITGCDGWHIGPSINVNMRDSETTDPNLKKKNVHKTPEIKHLLSRTDPVTRNTLLFVQKHIGKNWETVARRLGYSDAQIEQFREDYKKTAEIIYQILLDWTQYKPDEAQIGILFTALWKAREYEVVQRMANKNLTNSSD